MFSLKLEENLFYYGKVIKVELESTNVFLRGWNLIHIYDHPTKTRIDPSEMGSINQSLIIPPIVTNNKGWIDGYFLTVDNIPVTNTDLSIDYGFWDNIRGIYRSEGGETITGIPEYYTRYGLVSYGGIGRALAKIKNKEEYRL